MSMSEMLTLHTQSSVLRDSALQLLPRIPFINCPSAHPALDIATLWQLQDNLATTPLRLTAFDNLSFIAASQTWQQNRHSSVFSFAVYCYKKFSATCPVSNVNTNQSLTIQTFKTEFYQPHCECSIFFISRQPKSTLPHGSAIMHHSSNNVTNHEFQRKLSIVRDNARSASNPNVTKPTVIDSKPRVDGQKRIHRVRMQKLLPCHWYACRESERNHSNCLFFFHFYTSCIFFIPE